MNFLDRIISWFSPRWGQSRARARLLERHFDSASVGRRTSGWNRRITDANAAAGGASLAYLRAQARDLVRNNPWARRGLNRIVTNTVGWGIRPKATGGGADRIGELWKQWAETTECDAFGKLTFYGLQRLVMRTVVESGEVLVRRRLRRTDDGLSVPMQLQVLEPDYIDTDRDGFVTDSGNQVVQGVEFDLIGRRVAYYLFDRHPGANGFVSATSRRIPADGILHIYNVDRPGQVRGPSWFASVDLRLHDFDEFEDATLMKQKIAACMAAFVHDPGDGIALAEGSTSTTGQELDTFEPGMIHNLPPGKTVTVANPPQATDYQAFSASQLRAVAAGLGTTAEDLSGDYSQVNYSSARMARLAHIADIHDWRWNMLIPQFCAPAWSWLLDTLAMMGEQVETAPAEWTPAPLPMLDPDKEGQAITRALRSGQMTHDEMVREQGYDPDTYWPEYAASLKRLDRLGIVLDSDARRTNNSGQAQSTGAEQPSSGAPAKASNGVPKNGAKPNGAAGDPPSA